AAWVALRNASSRLVGVPSGRVTFSSDSRPRFSFILRSMSRMFSLCSCRRISSAPISRSTSVLMDRKLRLMRPIHSPAVRAAPGRRSGPRTIRATSPTRSSSLKPISNMARPGSVFLDRVFDLAGLTVDHGALLLVRYLLVGLVGLLLFAGLLFIGGVHRLAKALDGVAQVRA